MKTINGLDLTYKKSYKNAEMEIICEDDTLTTAKIYIDGTFHDMYDIGDENGLPNTKDKINEVWKNLEAEVDKAWNENVAILTQ